MTLFARIIPVTRCLPKSGDGLRLLSPKSAEKPRHSCRGGIGVGRAGLNAQEPNKTHAVPEPSMGEGTAEREAPAFMPGRTSRAADGAGSHPKAPRSPGIHAGEG